jgi:hypothetical protein
VEIVAGAAVGEVAAAAAVAVAVTVAAVAAYRSNFTTQMKYFKAL